MLSIDCCPFARADFLLERPFLLLTPLLLLDFELAEWTVEDFLAWAACECDVVAGLRCVVLLLVPAPVA